MKVLFISRAYGEHAGGMERLSFELMQTLERKQELVVTKLVHENNANKSLSWARLNSALFAITVIPRAIRAANNNDVVHLGDPVLSLVGWLIKKITKKPIAITVHGLDVRYSNPLYRLYLKTFFRDFNEYICISKHAKKSLTPWRVSGAITIIPPGMKDHYYSGEFPVKQNSLHLLTVGRLVKRKGHEWFIRNVLPSLPLNTVYTIAGAGPENENIETAISDTNQQEKVKLLGRVSPEKLKELLNSDAIFIQPNITVLNDAEGFGITMLEAALCDRLVLASNLDGIPDAIHNGKNGILLPAENPKAWINKITEIYQGNTEPLKARQYTLETFSWKKIGQQYIAVFEKLTQPAQQK